MNKKDKMEISEGKGRFQKDILNGVWMNGMADAICFDFLVIVGLRCKEKNALKHSFWMSPPPQFLGKNLLEKLDGLVEEEILIKSI